MKRLVLVPFEWSGDLQLLKSVAQRTAAPFALSPSVWPEALSMEGCYDTSRGQFNSREVLRQLTRFPSGDWVLGVTSVDLFLPIFTFVLGEAQLGGRAAVISAFRLREELYGLAPNSELVERRMEKEAVHELGHCHGLLHCRDSRCVMFAATTVEDVDLRGAGFCMACRSTLLASHETIAGGENAGPHGDHD
jgi:archaemetzincin